MVTVATIICEALMATKSVTLRTVEALKPGETIWDGGREAVKGFGARRQVAGAVYVLKYRFRGSQRFYTIGRHGAPWTPETARSEQSGSSVSFITLPPRATLRARRRLPRRSRL
jgi:hypothetical protein